MVGVMVIPRHLNPFTVLVKGWFIVGFIYSHVFKNMTEGLMLFTLKPENSPNVSVRLVRLRPEVLRSVKSKRVSSAYITMRCLVSGTFIPEIKGVTSSLSQTVPLPERITLTREGIPEEYLL